MSRTTLAILIGGAVLSFTGCGTPSYPLPRQRTPRAGPEDLGLKQFVEMGSPSALQQIVRDVDSVPEGEYRWCHEHPELRFAITSTEHQRFLADLATTGETMAEMGPVDLTVSVNGSFLAKEHYAKPGSHHLDVPVAASMLKIGAENDVKLDPSTVYTAKRDGAKLSFILFRAGFVQTPPIPK